jgi:pimeloyl-ACP methyl ester carboxylesterase
VTSVSTRNATIDYEVQGAGPSLVLINGLGFGRWGFFKQVPALSRRFATITFDAREGRDPEGVIEGLASDVADLLAHLGVNRAHVLGTSLGGFVAQELALSRPELVARLVLVSTAHGGQGSERMSLGAMGEMFGLGARHPGVAGGLIVGAAYPDFDGSGLRETWKGLLGADDAGTPDLAQLDENLGDFAGVVKSLHPGGTQQWQALLQQTAPMWLDYAGLTPDDLRGIAAPALVLAEDRDELIPLDLMVALYRALPNAELAICPQADHFGPGTPERAGVFAGIIRDFAGRHTQAR